MELPADAHRCSSTNLKFNPHNSPMGVQDCLEKSTAAAEGKGKVKGLVGGEITLADASEPRLLSKKLKISMGTLNSLAAAKNASSNAQKASKKASELEDGLTAKDETRVDSPPPSDAQKLIDKYRKLGHKYVLDHEHQHGHEQCLKMMLKSFGECQTPTPLLELQPKCPVTYQLYP